MDRRTYMLNDVTFGLLLVPVTLHHVLLLIDFGFSRMYPITRLYTRGTSYLTISQFTSMSIHEKN
jgi:hypothetical protein